MLQCIESLASHLCWILPGLRKIEEFNCIPKWNIWTLLHCHLPRELECAGPSPSFREPLTWLITRSAGVADSVSNGHIIQVRVVVVAGGRFWKQGSQWTVWCSVYHSDVLSVPVDLARKLFAPRTSGYTQCWWFLRFAGDDVELARA